MLDPDLTWVAAPSRTVARYAYDAARARLYIEFRNHDLGYYTQVPPAVFESFAAAPSPGTFIREQLRGNARFPWVRVSYAPRTR